MRRQRSRGAGKGSDEHRSYELFRDALELDPTDPYALDNVLEREIETNSDLSPIADRRPALASALLRRKGQALAGEDLPWSFLPRKVRIVPGRGRGQCVASFAAAVATSSAAFMLETTVRSLERVRPACERMAEYRWAGYSTSLNSESSAVRGDTPRGAKIGVGDRRWVGCRGRGSHHGLSRGDRRRFSGAL
jgi:hypothetical protein